jgi:hypothetical protein
MFQPLGDILKKRFKELGLKQGLTEKIFKKWKEVVIEEFDKEMEEKTQPLMIKKERLIIKVENPIIARELQAKKDKLIALINDEGLGSNLIKDISFRV